MTWLNPWAWLGLSAIAVPLLVHLLARRQARPMPFPTLRFLGPPRTVLARRDRLSDIALLVVRAAIVVFAVAALAQPHGRTGGRDRELDRTLARAVLVDASVSMTRPTPAGGNALDAARREAQRLVAEASASSVRETDSPARDLDGEVAWLHTQSGRRELIVVSDFQTSAISQADLTTVPADVGIRLIRIEIVPSAAPLEVSATSETHARTTLSPTETTVEWTSRPRSRQAAGNWPLLLASAEERAAADAALDAAREFGAPSMPAGRAVVVAFPGFAGRDLLIKDAVALSEPWMFDAVQRLRHDSALAAAARPATTNLSAGADARLTTVATDAHGTPVIVATTDRSQGGSRLLLLTSANPGTLASAALIAGVLRALSPATPPEEIDPATIPDDTLRQWERTSSSVAPPVRDDGSTSDGRWFWIVALLLLAVETWMRRRVRSDIAKQPEVPRARVA